MATLPRLPDQHFVASRSGVCRINSCGERGRGRGRERGGEGKREREREREEERQYSEWGVSLSMRWYIWRLTCVLGL